MQGGRVIPYIIIGILLSVIVWDFFFRKEVPDIPPPKADTVVVYKRDTIRETVFVPKKETVLDTLYRIIYEKDTVFLPMIQRHYNRKGIYDLWISGVNPKLDSLNIYQQTEIREITKEVEKYRIYAHLGVYAMPNGFAPMAEISLLEPKRYAFSVGVGYYDRKAVFGAKIGIKLGSF